METTALEINVAQLLKSPEGTIRDYEVQDEVEDDAGVYPVHGQVRLTHANERILVQGTLTTGASFTCSRCLKDFTCNIDLPIQEEFHPTLDIETGAKLPPPDESGAFMINEHHVLDLLEAVRQYRLLALPMKPLCKAECAGLCPTCGTDLNEGPCGCPADNADPRWTELLRLKRKGKKQDDTTPQA